MTISTLEGYAIAHTQTIVMRHFGTSNLTTFNWECTCNGLQQLPSGSAMAATDLHGFVPVAGDSGICALSSIDSSASAYIKAIRYSVITGGVRCLVYDRLFYTGYFDLSTYGSPSGTLSLTAQPSFSSRLPGGSYAGTMLLLEMFNSPGGGTPSYTVGYTNELGVSGRTATLSGGGAFLVRQMSLQGADKGVQRIDSFAIGASGTTGQPGVVIARPLAYFRADANVQAEGLIPLDGLGLRIYPTSALTFIFAKDGDSSVRPTIHVEIEIASDGT
jgi:hypothetical protein